MTDDSDDSFGPGRPRIHAPRWPKPPAVAGPAAGRARYPERTAARPLGPRHGFRYRVDLEYLGTRYSGWQFQTNARTVAGEIMEAIHRATGQRVIEVYGSGRTDAGVHAIHQVAHIDLAKQVDPDEFMRTVNDELPGDINLLKVELAPEGFHARHSATARTYIYRISRRRSAFDKPVVWWVRDPLDVAAMSQAAKSLCGLHDFSAFSQADPSRPDESTKVKVEAVDVFEEGPNIYIRIQGSHFLWKMVRRIVGVLVEVGRGRLTVADLAKIMKASGASVAEFTAPPSGLSLEKVTYGVPAPVREEREEPRRTPSSADARFRPRPGATHERPRGDRPHGHGRKSGFDAVKPRSGFRPQAERSAAGPDRPEAGWPRRSASPESPPAQGKQTFRRRG
ncbi:MAG: tRNA pseudouridine(38-40) synthase TruA [Vicinamibacteria bacterium]|nr:tRNA pseudouridine(38-40) synthase TruA [Vicinamibacteria bacterium]